MTKKEIIRKPAVAGSFYPADKTELSKMINDFLAEASSQAATGSPKIIIVPHAGYAYSGGVAAHGFKPLLGKDIKQAIIIGPSHHFPLSGLFLSGAGIWQTPLGSVDIAAMNSELAKENNFEINDKIHQPEHSLELEIPFLQTVLPSIKIIPIIVGQLDSKQRSDFASVLNLYLDSQTVLIVSLDLSHYHPYDEAVKLDKKSIQNILDLNSEDVLDDEIDAPWAVSSILELARQNGLVPKLLEYMNSGDVTGDKKAVVGYSAIGFFQEIKKSHLRPVGFGGQAINQENNKDEYSEAEKSELLKVARTALEQYVKTGKTYEPKTDYQKLLEKRGVFVTLTKDGQLRGCIGYIEPIEALIEAVRDNAISAAAHDNRFMPVESSELKDIKIEISVLTPPKTDTIDEIIKFKKGVVLRQGNRGATYLPQVWEDLSDPTQFFQSLCLKGGLDKNCYKNEDIQTMSYEAIVFSE